MPTEQLKQNLQNLSKSGIRYKIIHRENIEELLVGYPNREQLFSRYFPSSYKQWKELHYYREPVELFNYYFRKEYSTSIQHLVNALFGPPENMLKYLRLSDSFAALVARFEQNLSVVVHPKMGDFAREVAEELLKLAKPEMEKGQFKMEDPSSLKFTDPKPPISAQAPPHEFRGSTLDPNGVQSWILYTSILVVTTELDAQLNTMFLDLKSKV